MNPSQQGAIAEMAIALEATKLGIDTTTYAADEIDAVAAYCPDLDRCYLLPISLVAGRTGIFLRLQPARNNQELGVNYAERYELGAIAQLGERRAGSA
jgi:hypothetical protein